jgi:hypothetical protein
MMMTMSSKKATNKDEGIEAFWALALVAIIVLTFVVPYTILKDVASLWGAYAFWTLLTAITIALVCAFMSKWKG